MATNAQILLMDADLQNINKEEIITAVNAMHHHPYIDMIILRRMRAPWFVKMDRGDILFSGKGLSAEKTCLMYWQWK